MKLNKYYFKLFLCNLEEFDAYNFFVNNFMINPLFLASSKSVKRSAKQCSNNPTNARKASRNGKCKFERNQILLTRSWNYGKESIVEILFLHILG